VTVVTITDLNGDFVTITEIGPFKRPLRIDGCQNETIL